MATSQVDTARLIAQFVSCVLYGILLSTFVRCLRSLLFSCQKLQWQVKSRHEIKWPILATTISMFLVSTFTAVVSTKDVIDAFIDYHGPGGALEFYSGDSDVDLGWTRWIPTIDDSVQVILGDGLLIYRCYVLYVRNWRVIVLPAVAWMGLVAMAITSSVREAAFKPSEKLNDPSIIPFLATTVVFTFMTSVITTYLIIRRLLTVEFRQTGPGGIQPRILKRIATIFFETGLINTLSIVVSLSVYLAESNLEYVATLGIIHIVPITCNVLLIRVEGINRAERSEWKGSYNSTAVGEA
ncbi:hypothetical protein B0H12DRAFT_183776 [Mycena haematopus]|nr:hypothetical protein B0H12DRAFT_183776 [Mycena haematopus]